MYGRDSRFERASQGHTVGSPDDLRGGACAVGDARGYIRAANRALGRMLGTEPSVVAGWPLWDLVREDRRPEFRDRMTEALLCGARVRFETTVISSRGIPLPVDVVVDPVSDDETRHPGGIACRLLFFRRCGDGSKAVPPGCGDAGGWAELLFRISRFLTSSPENLTRRLERVVGWVAEDTANAFAVWRCRGEEIERVVLAFRDVGGDGASLRIESDSRPRSRVSTCPVATAIKLMETQLLFSERTAGGAARAGGGSSPGRDNGEGRPLTGVVVPLRLRGEGAGALGLFSLAGGPEFTSSHVGFAEDLAGILALAIECEDRDSEVLRAGERVRKIVAHDLRNHLTNLAVIFEDHEFVEDLEARQNRAAWERARLSYRQIVRLAQDLADEPGALSVRPGSVEVGPIVAAVREIHMAAASEKGIRLSVDIASGLPRVRADRGRLVQALSNLVQNGIKFTPEGGEVAIRVRREGEETRITVADSGPGIPEEDRTLVFEPGWRGETRGEERTEGSGIGLASARECVEAQGGRLWVCADGPTGGATLSIALPVAGARDGKLRRPASPDSSSRQGVGCEAVG